jgi:modulator of FtsH protease HflK
MTGWRATLATLQRRRDVRLGAAALGVLAWTASGLYTVPPTTVAVTRLFGTVTGTAVPPGVHWWWPRPVGRIDRVPVTRTFSLPLGFRPAADGQADTSDPVESRWLTSDTNILHLRSTVTWRIGDPRDYLLHCEAPEQILRLAVGAAFTATASALPVDDVLTSGRLVLRERVRTRTQEMLDAWRVGVQVLAVNLDAVEAPPVVVKAFQDVQDARADRERLVSEAETYANSAIPLARGEAEKTVRQAMAFGDQRLNVARADAERFGQLAAEHARSPALLEKRLYLETVERVLPRVRRYVLEPGNEHSIPIRLVE